jgi:SPP1 family phage portal protein
MSGVVLDQVKAQDLFIGDRLDIQTIVNLYNDTATAREEIHDRYNRYIVADLPILDRTMNYYDASGVERQRPYQENNQLVNSFESIIVNRKRDYLFSNHIDYNLNGDYGEKQKENIIAFLTDYHRRSNWDSVNSEVGKMAAICGFGVKIIRVGGKDDAGTYILSEDMKPWEFVFIGKRVYDADMVIRAYTTDVIEDNQAQGQNVFEIYTPDAIYVYDGHIIEVKDNDGKYVLDEYGKKVTREEFILRDGYPQDHPFGIVPVIGYPNNRELMSDFERVESLIDNYNVTTSNCANEITQLAQAILAAIGFEVDNETIQKLKQAGIINIQDVDGRARLEYVVKAINDAFIENHKATLENNIYVFSETPNLTDQAFGGTQTGVSMRYKLSGFIGKVKDTEQKFKTGLYQEFAAISNYAKTLKSIAFNPYDLQFSFTYNEPVDKEAEARYLATMGALPSKRTALMKSQLIENVDEELERIDEERQIDLSMIDIEDEEVEE